MKQDRPTSYEEAKAIREEYAEKLGLDPGKTCFSKPRFGAGKGVIPAVTAYLEMMNNPGKRTDEERIAIREAFQDACFNNPDPEELTTEDWGEAFEATGGSTSGSCKIN